MASPSQRPEREAVIARAHVWSPVSVSSVNIKRGPGGHGAFPFGATVPCEYSDKQLNGNSPKFACVTPEGDELKVKFGGANGEVYGEVLATRLLWALGFGADRMYPVNVICRGCPSDFGGLQRSNGESRFDPAVIERRMTGAEWPADGPQGWNWNELELVNAASGGAPREQVDALKLLAVFLQHTDSKPQQQRILCLDPREENDARCRRPFLMISDVGLTFGRANRSNGNAIGGVNLVEWQRVPVWKEPVGCVGNLPRSLTGTLDDPSISEGGRQFLARLLGALSDGQIRDLFEVARVSLRPRSPVDVRTGLATVDEWTSAFKAKRAEIATRRCA